MVLSELQLYKTARLLLNVEEGMTDEDDVEHLEWLLEEFLLLTRSDLNKVLSKNWNSEDIDMHILEAYLSEGA